MKMSIWSSYSRLVFCCTIFLLQSARIVAIDVAGSQLTYTNLGGPVYQVTYTHFRDCFGPQQAPTFLLLDVKSTSCGVVQQFTMTLVAGTGNEISNACPTAQTTCVAGFVLGIQKWEYEVVITIAGQCNDWIFSTELCCFTMPTTIGNNFHNRGTYAEAKLNNLNRDNSSPQFSNDPVISICLNEIFHYNNGMYDGDGDSLSYSLTPVLYDTGNTAPYNPGYSGSQPVTSAPPVSFDSITGDLFIRPVSVEVGLIAYTVHDWHNGELMGSVTRTIVLHTKTCNNQTPILTGINGSLMFDLYTLPGIPFCFDIFSSDPDTAQQLIMFGNNGIPGAAFSSAGAPHPTGTFCWTPGLSDVSNNPHLFTVTIADDNCPYRAVGVYSYRIYVTLDSSLVFAGLSEANEQQHAIYPNPAKDLISIQSDEPISRIAIFNSMGQWLFGGHIERVDISFLPDGIYFLEIETAQKIFRKKFLKQKD